MQVLGLVLIALGFLLQAVAVLGISPGSPGISALPRHGLSSQAMISFKPAMLKTTANKRCSVW